MILIDTSVWIDHFRQTNDRLVALLNNAAALAHPFVIGEIALGSLRDRAKVIADLSVLPQAVEASHVEGLGLIERRTLFSQGLGYVDAHLIASTLLTRGARFWTNDKRLGSIADELGINARQAMN